jgi:G patch domain-containing protein 1
LGALNDAEEDDVDVYDSGLHNSRRRIAFEAGDEDEERAAFSKTSTKQVRISFSSALQ